MGKYRDLGAQFNRAFRNDLNANFNDIDVDIVRLGAGAEQAIQAADEANTQALYAQTQGDYANTEGTFASEQGTFAQTQGNFAQTQGDYAKQIGDENKTRFLTAVASVTDRDTNYPTPMHGDTVRVTSEAKSYRYVQGTGWVVTDVYNPTAIDEVNVQLAETEQQLNLSTPYLTNFFKALEKGHATVAFLGDSVTAANEPNNFYSHPEYLQAWFDTKYGAGKVAVINAGNGGNDARMMNTRVARDVINDEPDAIIINSGWNDIGLGHTATYEHYMNRIISIIKETTKKPVDIVIRTTNVGTSSNMTELRSVITPAIFRLAKRHNAQIFDLLGIMDKDINNGSLVLADTLADDKHPNSAGQEYISNQFKPLFDTEVKLTKQSESPQFISETDYIPATDSRVVNSGFANLTEDPTNSYSPYGISIGAGSYATRTATLKFYGRKIGVSVITGEFTGILNVTIDGVSVSSIDTYEEQDNVTFDRNVRTFYYDGLSDGEHTIVLSQSPTSNPLSTGVTVTINGFVVEKKFSSYYKIAPKLTGIKLYYNAADKGTRVDVINNTTAFILPFDRIQTNNGSTAAVSDNAITAGETGFYHVLGSVKTLAGNIDGRLIIRVNGSNRNMVSVEHSSVFTSDRIDQVVAQLWLTAGDKVTFVYQRMSGDNVSIKYDNNNDTNLQIVKTL